MHLLAHGIADPNGIALGADRNPWFTSTTSHWVGRITPAGAIATFTDVSIRAPNGPAAADPGAGLSVGRATCRLLHQSRDVQLGEAGGVPAGAAAALLNVTVTGTTTSGYLTIWPAGQAAPLASSLNWSSGQTVPNAVTAEVGASGRGR